MRDFYIQLHADQDSYEFMNHNYVQFYLIKNEDKYKVIHEDSEKAKRFYFGPHFSVQRVDLEIYYIKKEIIPYVSKYIDRVRRLGR